MILNSTLVFDHRSLNSSNLVGLSNFENPTSRRALRFRCCPLKYSSIDLFHFVFEANLDIDYFQSSATPDSTN